MAKLNKKELEWAEARQRYGLSHAEVQMARELDIVPRSFAKVADPDVAAMVRQLYLERFGRELPEVVLSIEDRAKLEQKEKAMKKIHRPKDLPKEAPAAPALPAPKKRKKNRPHVSIPPRGRN